MSAPRNTDRFPQHIIPLADRHEVHTFIWCSSIFCVLVAIWTALRVYSRKVRAMPLVLEDMLYSVSVVTFYGFVAALYMATYLGGAGYHMSDLNSWHVSRITQSFLFIQALYGASMCAVKWSMLFMLKRIFAVRYFQIVTWIIIALQAGWLLQTLLIGFLICRPVQKNWDPTTPGVCGSRIAGYTSVSVVNVIVDCLMLILPLPMIFNLQVKQGYKVGLFCIFSIGVVTVVFSIIRLLSLNSIDFNDFAYTVVPVMTWSTAEVGVIIMVASSALLRPVFDKLFGSLLSLSASKKRPGASEQYTYGKGSRSGLGRRKEFLPVTDADANDSENYLELGAVRKAHTEVTVGSRASQGDLLNSISATGEESSKDLQSGIIVKSTVSQTFSTK